MGFCGYQRLDYGDQSIEIVSQAESHRHELYKRSEDLPENLDFVGVFSHSLEVREADGGSNSPNESELKLQKDYELLNEEKAASTAAIVDYGELPQARNARWGGALKKASYLKRQNKKSLSAPSSGPPTPSMRSGRSPLNPTSASTSTSAEARAELDALRIPLTHLLVLGPASEHSLASKTRAPEDLVLKVLHKVANKVNAGRHWALMDDVHRELDVWDFPYITPSDREKAIRNCGEAFNRLRLQKQAAEWRMLLSPEDRERADLNPEPEPVKPASVRLSSRPASESGRSPLPPSLESKKPAAKAATGRGAAKVTKPTKTDAISRIIGGKGRKKATVPAKPKGTVGRPPKNASAATGRASKPATQRQTVATTNSKIKSAEVVVDSDDDIDMEDVKLSTPKPPPVSKVGSPQPRPKASAPKPPSRVASDIEGDGVYLNPNRKRTPAPSAAKSPAKRPRIVATPSASSSATLDPPVQFQSQSNGYSKAQSSATITAKSMASSRDTLSRSSSSNSPPKPSPLGSSPPINASDDTGSTASSPFMMSNAGTSTASQSPLDSLSGRSQKPRYMPPAVSSLKRKAGSASQRDDPVRSGTKATSNGTASNRRQLANPPDGQTMKLARKFKEDYSKYARLYHEAQSVTDAVRKRETIERVLALHRDLERLKARISNLQMSH
ncbi:hypothetical protein BZA05DRAFT_58851 [Tricharina praecox]|uniref:uncharacterized protein n=1 Tax=Tricharina praecox TaxID=43433 RepID=UPI00221EF20C|nr:uncharacterized protein BZA05DRAFT_58851 [Tricharina praecox]KAI5850624.1 hypothetical protein BZA05DRAFT_58851 [Tricharina praecox]